MKKMLPVIATAVLAGALWDHFGEVPLRWTCTPDDLASVRGVGPIRAGKLWSALMGHDHEGDDTAT